MIQGVSEAAQTVSFPEMSQRQQALAKIILKDPAVESLSSFIGIDGTNTTLNSGRIQINLKPLDERKISASDVIRRLQPQLAQVAGITLFMQPVQDLTVEDRVSRTQFQYTLEDPNADELNTYAPQDAGEAAEAAGIARRGQRSAGAGLAGQAGLRPRHGLAPGHHALDDRPDALRRLRPAPGLHHVHAVEPVSRGAGSDAGVSARIRWICAICSSAPACGVATGGCGRGRRRIVGDADFRPVKRLGSRDRRAHRTGVGVTVTTVGVQRRLRQRHRFDAAFPERRTGAAQRFHAHRNDHASPITVNHQGQFPVVTLSFNLAPNASLGDAVNAVNKVKDEIGMPPSIQAAFQGTAEAFQASLANEPVLILAALVTVYIVLGVLYESYIHPITILSTLPSAGVGALLALIICRQRFQRDRA